MMLKPPNQIAIEALTKIAALGYPPDAKVAHDALAAIAATTPPAQGSIDAPIPSWRDRARYDKVVIENLVSQVPYMDAELTDLRNFRRAVLADRAARQSGAPGEVIGFANPEEVFAQFCEQRGYPSDGEWDGPLRAAFNEGMDFCKSTAPHIKPTSDDAPAPSEPVPQGVPFAYHCERLDKLSDNPVWVPDLSYGKPMKTAFEQIADVVPLYRIAAPTATSGGEAVGLLANLTEAAAKLREYETYHRAKGTADSIAKAEVNADLAGRFEATIARTRLAPPPLPATDLSETYAADVWVPDEIDPRSKRYPADYIEGFNRCRTQVIENNKDRK